ncbi:hypothetical protein RclHR1_01650024 [Rhizophagus clarus]|uniref:Uncharacterized protein n=1 Tax=Rhizophagus clarus TaxID=94130 RepID=A0A2Z6QHS6_9GLOM|nr:hypothetical protein RclHR1_01650024 [Rhizophagus clarus]GES73274.1 hypothetical protein GLOIN_2v1590553 [Rhizophagus clarus]
MDLIDLLNQYGTVIFPNLGILQKAIKDILESFQHLRKINDDDKQLVKLNRKFNELVDVRAKESLKMSGDLERVVGYFKMLTEDDITVSDLLETLLVLKDVAENRIISSKKSEEEFVDFRKSIQLINGIQPPNFLSALWQISLEVIRPGIPILSTFVLHFIVRKSSRLGKTFNLLPEKIGSIFEENAQQFNLSITNHLSSSHLSFCLAFMGFGYCFYNRKKEISKKAKDLMYAAVKGNRLTTRKNVADNKEERKKSEEKISTKLQVISTYLETLTQFWTQQFNIYELHINALKSMDGNVNIRLQKNLAAGIIEKCTEEKNNSQECYLMLKDYVYEYSV